MAAGSPYAGRQLLDWLFQDLAGSVTLLFAGAGFLFAGWKLRTGRRMRKKISNIVATPPT